MEQKGQYFDASDKNLFEESLHNVADTYAIASRFYPTLEDDFEATVEQWREDKMEEWSEKQQRGAASRGDHDGVFDDEFLTQGDFSIDDVLYG